MKGYLIELRAFSRWLLATVPDARSPAAITRDVLIDYILYVRSSGLAAATQQRRVGTLRALLTEQGEDGLVGLAAGAVIHGPEIPSVDYRVASAHTPRTRSSTPTTTANRPERPTAPLLARKSRPSRAHRWIRAETGHAS